MTKNMTVGNPTKLILLFSIPLLIGNVFQQFYNMVDTIIVGRFIGVDALAALGSTGSLFFLLTGFVNGLTGGFGVMVAQKFGAEDHEGLRHSVATSVILCIIVSILLTVLGVSSVHWMLRTMNTPDNIISEASAYISVIYGGIGATVFYNMLSSILRALGDSKTPLYFLIISSILNIVLDLYFIVKLSLGVAGAGYATVIAQLVSGILCLIYMKKKYKILKLKKHHWKIDIPFAKEHLKIGLPMALQFSITAVGVMVIQSALNTFGSTTIAAYTAASKVEQLVMQPPITFGVTMATYAGQNLGAKRIDRIKEGVKKCTIIAVIISLLAGSIMLLFGDSFVRIFIENPSTEVVNAAKHYLNIASFFFFPLSLIFIYRNTLQGMGDAFIPMMAGVAELLVRVIVAFTLPAFIGYTGICIANPTAWVAAALPLGIKYFITIRQMSNDSSYLKNTIESESVS